MHQQKLDEDLKTISERSPRPLTENFNRRVWAGIREAESSAPRTRTWRDVLVFVLSKPQWAVAVLVVTLLLGWSAGNLLKSSGPQPSNIASVTGEVIDLACYYDDGATGPDHAACARRCIESGLPVGIKTKDGKVYLLIGEPIPLDEQLAKNIGKHKTLNQQLAPYAAKIVTVNGRIVSKEGADVVENAHLAQPNGEASTGFVSMGPAVADR